jgi:predicted P-loop ATPase
MKTIKLSYAPSRTAKNWDNQEITYDELLEQLRIPQRTPETVAEYRKMTPEKRGKIKDVGGFVGGYLLNGQRNKNSVQLRSILTLDIDEGCIDIVHRIGVKLPQLEWAIYSTHSSTPEAPRIRLLLPLQHDISPDEYIALSRAIAHQVGIDYFDDTTYEPSRLMYLPSCSKDAEYLFHRHAGQWLDAETYLHQAYADWHDQNQWYRSSREQMRQQKPQSSGLKRRDPRQHAGVSGLFARAHGDIHHIIATYLSRVYQRSATASDRYTYINASTSNGVVIYDNQFLYSHHSTDPLEGRLLTGFEAVQLHLFGHLDEGKRTHQLQNLPSYKAMLKLVRDDADCRRFRLKEWQEKNTLMTPEERKAATWMEQLELTRDDKIKPTETNAKLLVLHDQPLQSLRYDEFNHCFFTLDRYPWRIPHRKGEEEWRNLDESSLRIYLNEKYGFSGMQHVVDALLNLANQEERRVHPVRNKIKAESWDGIPRVDTVIIDYLGGEDTPLSRAMTRKTFIAAVKRIFEPGCKHDYCLVLISPEGMHKSSFWNDLSGDFFNDSFTNFKGKDSMELLDGSWIVELAELSAYRKADIETVKSFLSRKVDKFRPSYGRIAEKHPRQSIFVGTTNVRNFLHGNTGNRRFWPIELDHAPRLPYAQLKDVVPQLWAEAYTRYLEGEKTYFEAEMETEAVQKQFNHTEEDINQVSVASWIIRKVPPKWGQRTLDERRFWWNTEYKQHAEDDNLSYRSRICAQEVAMEFFDFRYVNGRQSRAINRILDGIEWLEKEKSPTRHDIYGNQRCYKVNIERL